MTRLKVFNKISLSSFKEHDDQYKRKHAVANGYAPSSYKRKPHGYCSDFEEVSNRYITNFFDKGYGIRGVGCRWEIGYEIKFFF